MGGGVARKVIVLQLNNCWRSRTI